ncbi:VWA domain-containing protein [Devosia sp. 2618]|uniref:VWA domain-containing protein n=1 Tax=Devosia sp. 2618 TaxID=3156454 RepID=UPI0033923921
MLSFGLLAPAMLGLLAFAALVIWLHTTRPERRVVPSIQIWLTLPDLPGAARRRRKLPKLSALLLLQLAALAALVLALAQPFLGAPPPAHLVVVLDGSAQMRTASGQGTLFDVARAELARNLADQKGAPPQHVSLILAGPEPRLLAARHAYEPEAFVPLLDQASASDGPTDWTAVASLVRQTLDPTETATGLIVGGATPSVFATETGALPAFTHLPVLVPPLAPSLDLRLVPIDGQKWALKGTLRADQHLTNATVSIGFTVTADIGARPPLPWKRLDLKLTDGTARIDETLDLKEPGLVSVNAQAEDRQAWPGAEARFLTASLAPQRVLYIASTTASDQPLVRAIMAQDGLEVFRADALPQDIADYALVVVDGITLPEAPKAPTLWIGSAGVGEDLRDTAVVADADFWHPFHPLTGAEDWKTPSFSSVSTRPLPDGHEVLVAGASYPLLAVSTRGAFQDIHLKFDPRRVNWSSGDVLPLLTGAITDWLRLTDLPRANCQVGLPCAAETGTYVAVANGTTFNTDATVFTPLVSGLFRVPSGDLLAINSAPDRFGNTLAEAPATTPVDAPPLGLMWYLLLAAALFLAADAALRFRSSGKRALPALGALILVAAALVGLAFPLPFERSVRVELVPEGGNAAATGLAIAAGPSPRILRDGVQAPTAPAQVGGLSEPLPTTITHPAVALNLASALVPSHQVADIVAGAPVRSAIPAFSNSQLNLPANAYLEPASLPLRPATGPMITALALPADAAPGDRLGLTALVQSDIEIPVQIAFHANGTQLVVEDATLQHGMNRIETELPPLAVGETLFTVTVSIAGGRTSSLSAIAIARVGRPVLVLASDAVHGEAFAQLATATVPGIPPDGQPGLAVVNPANAPDYLRDWLDFDAVVLLNMPARAVTSREAGLIESAVTRHGLGLVMLGGGNAFGPGGYFATPFEKLSPLSARVPREAPEVTMVFVLDRSGSMNQQVAGGTRLEMARQATQGAIALLNPESRVGIVVFDTEARIVLPLTIASDADAVRAALATVDTGGGTAIAPGLLAGWELLRGSEAQARHMIVMTDGLSTPGDFTGIATAMRAEGITVSAVAVGTGADAKAVAEIAAAGGGSVHASDDFATLPSILSQEAMLLSSPVREGQGQPQLGDLSDPLLRGLPTRLPPVDGVVLTTAKPDARVALTTTTPDGEEAPLLATWRQGNGQVLAFSSDVTGNWTRNWQADPSLAALWPHVLRQIRPTRPANGPWLRLADTGEQMLLTLEALDSEGAPREGLAAIAAIEIDGAAALNLQMTEIKPGIYEASFAPEKAGRIAARVALPAESRRPVSGQTAPTEEIAETAYYRSRPFWAEPLVDQPLLVAGGAASVPTGWGVRLVPGVTAPWLVLALLAFLTALVFYMRPARPTSRRTVPDAHTRSDEGIAS